MAGPYRGVRTCAGACPTCGSTVCGCAPAGDLSLRVVYNGGVVGGLECFSGSDTTYCVEDPINGAPFYECTYPAFDVTHTLYYQGVHPVTGEPWWASDCVAEASTETLLCEDGETFGIDCDERPTRYVLVCGGFSTLTLYRRVVCSEDDCDLLDPETVCGLVIGPCAFDQDGSIATDIDPCCDPFRYGPFVPTVLSGQEGDFEFYLYDPAEEDSEFTCCTGDVFEPFCPCDEEDCDPRLKRVTMETMYGDFEASLVPASPGATADTGPRVVTGPGIASITPDEGCDCPGSNLITTGTVTHQVRYQLSYDCTNATLIKTIYHSGIGTTNPNNPVGPCIFRIGPIDNSLTGFFGDSLVVSDTISYNGCGAMVFNLPDPDLPEGSFGDPEVCDEETDYTLVVGFTMAETVTVTHNA